MASSADVMRVKLTAEGIVEVIDALKRVESQASKTAKAGLDVEKGIGSLGVLFAAQKIAAFAASAIDAADGLYKMSQKTGVAVDQLSVLTFMGQQAELANQDLEKSMIKLAKSFDALERGDSAAAEAFQRIGLSAAELKGLSLDQVLLKVADAQGKYADGAAKAAVMTTLMGKSGANAIPLLNDMANGGFEQARKKLEALGLVLSSDMAKASQDFNDSMKRTELAAKGASLQVAQTFLPGLTKSVDALTAALAGTPMVIKGFAGSWLLVGSASTAAAVAIRALYTAIAGLGPIGLAVVALATLTAGIMAYQASQERAHAEAVAENRQQNERVKRGRELIDQMKKESELLEKTGLTVRERKVHEEALKKIKDDLMKLSPDYKKAIENETGSITKQAEAAERVNKAEAQSLANKRKLLEQELILAKEALARLENESVAPGSISYGSASSQDAQANDASSLETRLSMAKRNVGRIQQLLSANKGEMSDEEKARKAAEEEEKKKRIEEQQKELAKAQAAERLAAAKRLAEDKKQSYEAFSTYIDDLYKQGLLSLEDYFSARRDILEKQTVSEIALLKAQIRAEREVQGTLATDAEKQASATKIADLENQIALKRGQNTIKQQVELRKERDARQQAGLEALKLEADLEEAKGRTGEAAIRAIEAEYAKRIQEASSAAARESLSGLRDSAVSQTQLKAVTRKADLGNQKLNIQLGSVDAQQAQGLITEEEAIRRKIALYRELIPVLEVAAQEQMRIARQTGNPEDLLKAQDNVVAVEQLKGSLRGLTDQLDWVKTTARDAFENGLSNFLQSLTDQTTTLTDKILALGKAIAQALFQQATARIAASITTSIFGPAPGRAEGGYIAGPGTSTSDSIPAWLSNGEYVVRAAAVQRYGVGFLNAINGLAVPRSGGSHFAQGGLVAGSGASAGLGPVTVTINVYPGGDSSVSGTGNFGALGAQFRKMVVPVVMEVLATELRPGGSLYKGR